MKTIELQRSSIGINGGVKKKRYASFGNMEAIARGVQARIEESSGFSRKVTEATVGIARELGIPEAEIQRWVTLRLSRLVHETQELKAVKSHLEGLKVSSLEY